jgi:hypothetical protein
MIKKRCKFCDGEYKTSTEDRHFCSNKCFRLWRQENGYIINTKELEIYNLFVTKDGKIKGGKCFGKNHKVNNGRDPWNKDKTGVQTAWNKGMTMKNYYDEEQYKKFIDGCIKGGVACCLKVANNNNKTTIEIALEEIVKELGIKYLTQYPLLGITVADIYLPDKHIAIYADGDYWHNYPHGTKKDFQVNKERKSNPFRQLLSELGEFGRFCSR